MPIRFSDYVLDPAQRTLTRAGAPVELNARYFDALTLLVGAPGELVTKDRFMGEVWRGIPVTDEALTQCIRTLRRQLGDDAARPRFIETVPKHGYRFIAPLDDVAAVATVPPRGTAPMQPWARILRLAGMGTIGGGVAGVLGGIAYGFLATVQPGTGAASTLLVLLCITSTIALAGAGAVSGGIALAELAGERRWLWRVVGGAGGGLAIGAIVKLLGSDAMTLLFGSAPTGMTGGGEGLVLGAATALACGLAMRGDAMAPIAPRAGVAALIGAVTGAAIPMLGGRLMRGSLDSLARQFPASRLRLDPFGALIGEGEVGRLSQILSGAMEGGLFVGCVAAAMALAWRDMAKQ